MLFRSGVLGSAFTGTNPAPNEVIVLVTLSLACFILAICASLLGKWMAMEAVVQTDSWTTCFKDIEADAEVSCFSRGITLLVLSTGGIACFCGLSLLLFGFFAFAHITESGSWPDGIVTIAAFFTAFLLGLALAATFIYMDCHEKIRDRFKGKKVC